MTTSPSGAVRAACLLSALEPGAERRRIETALVLLGLRAGALAEAVGQGLLRASNGRLDLVDHRVGRAVVEGAGARERRTAHLALACVHTSDQVAARRSFDALCLTLEPAPVPPPARARTPHEVLTPQERHVAELASTGARTSEIAAAAFLTTKTVEYHLTSIYRKLGVRSKAELVLLLRSADLVTVGH